MRAKAREMVFSGFVDGMATERSFTVFLKLLKGNL
jgi:hypothetical protein